MKRRARAGDAARRRAGAAALRRDRRGPPARPPVTLNSSPASGTRLPSEHLHGLPGTCLVDLVASLVEHRSHAAPGHAGQHRIALSSVPFLTSTVATGPRPLSRCASITTPRASDVGVRLEIELTSAVSRIISSETVEVASLLSPRRPRRSVSPPHSSGTRPWSESCWRTRAGVRLGLVDLVDRRQFPQGGITDRANTASSDYHAMQSRYNGRFLSNSLTVGMAYTFSKTMDNASEIFAFADIASPNAQNPFCLQDCERSLSNLHRPHAFSANFIYDVPWFRDQRGLAGHILGGWQFNGTYILSSGSRYTTGSNF